MAKDPTKFLTQGNMGQEANQRETNDDILIWQLPNKQSCAK